MLGDKVPALVSDGGCLSKAVVGTLHKVGSTEADDYMVDGAACFAYGATDEAGRVPMLPYSTDCTTGKGNLCVGATAAVGGLVASA